jgi:hypothetical protein
MLSFCVTGKACRHGGRSAVGELREIVVDDGGHNALAEVVVADVEPARVLAELEAVAAARPDQVVVDLPLRHLAALGVGLVVAADGGEGRVGAAAGQHDGEGLKHLRVVVGQKEAGIPARAGVELIDQVRREQVRVAEHQRPLRLRRIRVEDGVDGVGVGGLQAGVLLEAVPDAVVRVDGVVDLDHDQVFAVAVVHRLGADVGAAAPSSRPCRAAARRSHRAGRRAPASACLRCCCRARTCSGRTPPPAAARAAWCH